MYVEIAGGQLVRGKNDGFLALCFQRWAVMYISFERLAEGSGAEGLYTPKRTNVEHTARNL